MQRTTVKRLSGVDRVVCFRIMEVLKPCSDM